MDEAKEPSIHVENTMSQNVMPCPIASDHISIRIIRSKWVVGDWVETYNKSRDEWCSAKIIEIYEGEWLFVKVENTMIKKINRFNEDVRPFGSETKVASTKDDTEIDEDEMKEIINMEVTQQNHVTKYHREIESERDSIFSPEYHSEWAGPWPIRGRVVQSTN